MSPSPHDDEMYPSDAQSDAFSPPPLPLPPQDDLAVEDARLRLLVASPPKAATKAKKTGAPLKKRKKTLQTLIEERTKLARHIQRFLQPTHWEMLRLPPDQRGDPTLREVFELMISRNTLDEPHAPPITIVNNIDPENEPCPPWEFRWTNSYFYGNDVPLPDRDQLKGCGCTGPCDPNSKACACVKRQAEYWEFGGFRYNKDRTIRRSYDEIQTQPIFECNSECDCPPNCGNRVSPFSPHLIFSTLST